MQTPNEPVSAVFFDGETAARHRVSVSIHRPTPPALIIDGEHPSLPLRWPLEKLRALPGQAGDTTISLTVVANTDDETPRDPARLVISDPEMREWIRGSRPNLLRRDVKSGTGFKIAARSLAAIGAFLVILFVILPLMANTLAELIPPEREAALGRATIRQFEVIFGGGDEKSLRCESPEADRVWAELAERFVDRERYNAPVKVIVLDHPMINAFAAPGGYIVFFRGMIDAASSPDEIAAVMAHEAGHVVARDPTRIALRSVGSAGILGLVLGDFTGGGIVLFLTEQLLSSSYSREAETAADLYAIEQLAEAGVDPAALGDLFETMREQFGDIEGPLRHFVSHPSLEDRIEAARAAGQAGTGAPILTEEEWQTIRTSCDGE